MEKKTWADYPYEFKPTKSLTTKEITMLLHHLFGMKGFPKDFIDGLPDEIKQHFNERENIFKKPTFIG